ncbi:MAG: tryptophan--tRNA ligase, partial [Vibrionaceae bacterium]
KTIANKIKRAVTDTQDPPQIIFDQENKPGVTNLLGLLSVATNTSIAELERAYQGKMYGHLKTDTADAIVAMLEPVQQRYHAFRNDTAYLEQVMQSGSEKASAQAAVTLARVYDAVGFIKRP